LASKKSTKVFLEKNFKKIRKNVKKILTGRKNKCNAKKNEVVRAGKKSDLVIKV